ncbi:MAG: AAA family ATPase, partial [Nanoarchaeota archaeon]|nr:AAA family ATPase [Nanoarchaeota archaeon]
MQGFKSFAKRTELEFDADFNVILGPNGSGKSNVLDALCFVLGKRSAKSLRAEKASNLIYNGGKSKQPAKYAEVIIVFDNKEKTFPYSTKDVTVSRRVSHKGTSTYRINEKKVTRQQVLDLLAIASINPDGYNIMLQGDITHFVEMSPIERRDIIGEIAGISVYEDKKKKAMNELGKVDSKLGEADIILKERGTYLKELKKERDQALKFKDLNDKIDQNQASYLKLQMDAKQEKINDVEKRKKGFSSDLDKVNNQIKEHKDKIKNNKDIISGITKTVEKEGDKDVNNLNKEIEDLRVDVASSKTQINSFKNELGRIDTRKEQLQKNIDDIESKNENYVKEVKELKQKKERLSNEEKRIIENITAFKKKHKLDSESERIETELEKIDKDAEERQSEAEQLRIRQHQLFREGDIIDIKLKTIDDKIEKMDQIKKENKEQLKALEQKRNEFKKATISLNKQIDLDSELSAKLGNARKELLEINEDLAKKKARSASIKESLSGDIAIESIMKNKSKFGGVYGSISELGEVGSKYALALEIA